MHFSLLLWKKNYAAQKRTIHASNTLSWWVFLANSQQQYKTVKTWDMNENMKWHVAERERQHHSSIDHRALDSLGKNSLFSIRQEKAGYWFWTFCSFSVIEIVWSRRKNEETLFNSYGVLSYFHRHKSRSKRFASVPSVPCSSSSLLVVLLVWLRN